MFRASPPPIVPEKRTPSAVHACGYGKSLGPTGLISRSAARKCSYAPDRIGGAGAGLRGREGKRGAAP